MIDSIKPLVFRNRRKSRAQRYPLPKKKVEMGIITFRWAAIRYKYLCFAALMKTPPPNWKLGAIIPKYIIHTITPRSRCDMYRVQNAEPAYPNRCTLKQNDVNNTKLRRMTFGTLLYMSVNFIDQRLDH